jgi:hypothetical protein
MSARENNEQIKEQKPKSAAPINGNRACVFDCVSAKKPRILCSNSELVLSNSFPFAAIGLCYYKIISKII